MPAGINHIPAPSANQVEPSCPADTQIGEMWIAVFDGQFNTSGVDLPGVAVPIYNMVPNEGKDGEPNSGQAALFSVLAPLINYRVDLTGGLVPSNGPGGYAFDVKITGLPPELEIYGTALELFGSPQEQNACSPTNPAASDPTHPLPTDVLQVGTTAAMVNGAVVPNCPGTVTDNAFITNTAACGTTETASLTATEYDPADLPTLQNDESLGAGGGHEPASFFQSSTNAPRGESVTQTYDIPPPSNCNNVLFNSATAGPPTLTLTPFTVSNNVATNQASVAHDSGTDLAVGLTFPGAANTAQNLSPSALGPPPLKNITVTLPNGFSINPGANPTGAGLQACADTDFANDNCANAAPGSQVGTVTLSSPDIGVPLTGTVYLGQPSANGGEFRLFIDACTTGTGPCTSGAVPAAEVHLEGSITSDPSTGQLTTTFANSPQVPVSSLQLSFTGGAGSAIATPIDCGTFTSPGGPSTSIVPWSGVNATSPQGTITVDADGAGGACPSPLAFSPTVTPNLSTTAAGASPTFTLTVTRPPGQQFISSLNISLPPGLTGHITAATQCTASAAALQAGTAACPVSSNVGTAAILAGSGSATNAFGGNVYLTGPYNGDPFGLIIVVPATLGPFNLGTSVVQAGIAIDPHDAHLTIQSSVPTIQDFTDPAGTVQGVPLRIQKLVIAVNRPGFMQNATNCSPQSGSSTLGGIDPYAGTTASSTSTYSIAATNCAALAYTPTLIASTNGKTSTANGASLDVTLTQPAGQANTKSVAIQIPTSLAARYTTEQAACPAATFAKGPSNCPASTIVGTVTATTPLLPGSLSGPAYYVYQAGVGLPNIDVVLSGDGVTFDLTISNSLNSKGLVSSLNAPDVPISSFSLDFTQGPNSLLSANGNLCAQKVDLATTLNAQSGASKTVSVAVKVQNCGAVLPFTTATLKLGKHSLKNGKLSYTVTAPMAGRVSLSGSVFHHTWTFKTVRKAGKTTITAALSHKVLMELRKHHHVTIKFRLGFLPKSNKFSPYNKALKLELKQAR